MTSNDTSFMRSLCMGIIEEDLILPFPELDSGEREMVRSVLQSVDGLLGPLENEFRQWDERGEIPGEFLRQLADFGLFGLVIPESHGGLGFRSTAYSRTLQQIARHDASIAVTIGAHSSIGMRGLLLYGTDEQRQRWYPKLASGEMIAAFCLTEPGAGSDAASIRTTAARDGDCWVLNGNKIWITNGGFADFFTVFAKTGDIDSRGKLSAFIVTRDMPGVSIGPHEDKMGIRASATNAVYFDHVRVPSDHLLGPLDGGFKVAMNILNSGRTGLGGGSIGAMKKVIESAAKHAGERRQFGRPIAEFGLVKQKLGEMMIDCYAAEATVTMLAGLIDAGNEDYAVEAAISKVFASEALWRTADEALQIAGGNGYMRDYPYERVLRDCRINKIFEGTNDVLRLFIALTAMKDVGTQLQEISSTLNHVFDHPIKGFGLLSQYARKHVSLATGFRREGSRFTRIHESLHREAEQFHDATRQLATATDRILRKHGRQVIEKQLATRRLADIMIDMFVFACVLSRVDHAVRRNGPEACARERDVLRGFAAHARRRIDRNLAEVDDNEDEAIKALADHAVANGGYPWDTV